MAINEALLQVSEYSGEGYKPLVDFGGWRVAVLRYIDELLPQNITVMQRHNETDEVFVLLAGRCILFIGEGGDMVERIEAAELQPYKLYNVRHGVWHTHTLDCDAHVLVIENRDTCNENSPHIPLTAGQTAELARLTGEVWG